MPKYDCLRYDLIPDVHETGSFDWGGCRVNVFKAVYERLPITFLEPNNGFFWVGCVYGCAPLVDG